MTHAMSSGPTDRFTPPRTGAPTPVTFPTIARTVLGNGLRVWSVAHAAIPVVTAVLLIDRGAADDPPHRPGLAGITADLTDEGAGGRDAIQLAEAFARFGLTLDVDVGPDVIAFGVTALSRVFAPALGLLADIVARPHLAAADLVRVRELRINRLRQLSQSAGTVADRAFLAAVFGAHPYGHGSLGTTASLEAVTLDDIRAYYARAFVPRAATLIVAGDVTHEAVVAAADAALASWTGPAPEAGPSGLVAPVELLGPEARTASILLVDRPGAPQSELRIGHTAPPRATPAYHELITLNAILGGDFSSRINRNLREAKGFTYGARTAFDLRRAGGSFVCQTSVQADATAPAIAEVLRECAAIRLDGAVEAVELMRAKASLTRGYVRNFETADELARGVFQLATYGLDDDTFDRFVPLIEAVTGSDVIDTARRFVRPDAFTIVVVGDAAGCRGPIEQLGMAVRAAVPEF
jgi:zinc protease